MGSAAEEERKMITDNYQMFVCSEATDSTAHIDVHDKYTLKTVSRVAMVTTQVIEEAIEGALNVWLQCHLMSVRQCYNMWCANSRD